PTWFTGGSARPILTADNPVCNSSTLSGTCIGTTDWYGAPSYYVTSCPYQVGGANSLVDVGYSKYVILDNFELTGICQSHTGQPGGADTYITYGGAQGPITFQNNYIHGASHLKFAARNGSSGCTTSTVCTNTFAFHGSVTNGTIGETIQYNVVDFGDSDPGGQGLCFGGFYNEAYNVFRYTTQCVTGQLHLFHDNLYEYFFENGHSNVLESGQFSDVGPITAVYNNVFRHIENYVTSGGGIILWQFPNVGNTDYGFNNLIYDVGTLEYINIGQSGTNTGSFVYFNNTLQTNTSQPVFRCELLQGGTMTDVNNHIIDDASSYFTSANCNGHLALSQTSLLMSNAKATSKGYTSSQTFAYSPTASNSPTVGAGTTEGNSNGAFCSALYTAAGSDSILTDAAIACNSDAHYGCS